MSEPQTVAVGGRRRSAADPRRIDPDAAYHEEKKDELAVLKAEEKKQGPPRLRRLFAGQDKPERFDLLIENEEDPDGDPLTGWVEIARLNNHDLKQWQNAGEEVALVDDQKTQSGRALRLVRSLNEESEALLMLCVTDWEIPTGELDDKKQPKVRRRADYTSDKSRLEFFRSLDPDTADYIEDLGRVKQGLAPRGFLTGGLFSSSSASSNGTTAG